MNCTSVYSLDQKLQGHVVFNPSQFPMWIHNVKSRHFIHIASHHKSAPEGFTIPSSYDTLDP